MNGYQLYVKHDDPGAVEAAIRAYVGEHGAMAVVDPTGDGQYPLGSTGRRHFTLAPPVDGTITVWEAGRWADRRLARALSERLATDAFWLMVNDATGSWAYTHYRAGAEVGAALEEPDDTHGAAKAFAAEHGLPYALEYLPDTSVDPLSTQMTESLRQQGFFDVQLPGGPFTPAPDQPTFDPPQRALDEAGDDLIELAIDVG